MRLFVILVLAASAVFVLWSGAQLPEQVGSHFDLSGRADAFMSRTAFTAAMLLAASVVPGLVWLLQLWAARSGKWNIRNRDHWFGAQHGKSTVRYLENQAGWFTIALAAFMVFVHWLVVQANTGAGAPPGLDNTAFLAALAVYFVFVIVWVSMLFVRFGKRT